MVTVIFMNEEIQRFNNGSTMFRPKLMIMALDILLVHAFYYLINFISHFINSISYYYKTTLSIIQPNRKR